MHAVAIITARGGSKRVPRKNIRLLCGRPLLAWPISAALDSRLFDRVIISTEDQEIAEIAIKEGAECLFMRPEELANDFSSTADVLRHALGFLFSAGSAVDICCCLYGTSYGVTPDILREARALLMFKDTEAVIAVKEYQHPIERALSLSPDGIISYRTPEFVSSRTQDLPRSYYDIGQFIWFKAEAFARHGSCTFSPLIKRAVIFPMLSCFDIDTESDFKTAESLLKNP